MIRYADTSVCPSCRVPLPVQPSTCPTCELPLREPLSLELLQTLTHADDLVARLRTLAATSSVVAAPASAAAPGPAPAPAPIPAPAPFSTPYPVSGPVPTSSPRRGVRTASVPAILLGLGALCLLVAALTFFAVAWSWLGFGGRTAVLVGLTVVSGGLALVLARRRLRIAGEALSLVSLGLLVLDVLGADRAGWLGGWWGDPTVAGLVCLVGLALAAAAAGLTAVPLPVAKLAVPQVVGVLGLYAASVALTSLIGRELVVEALAVPAFAALAWSARRATPGLSVLSAAAAVAAVLTWLDLTVTALAQALDLPELTFAALWMGGPGVALLVAAALLLGPVPFLRGRDPLAAISAAGAGALLTLTSVLPVLDEDLTRLGLAAIVATLVWTAVAVVLPTKHVLGAVLPAVLSALPLVGVLLAMLAQAGVRVLDVGRDLTLASSDPVAQPVLLPLAALTLLALGWVLVPPTRRPTPQGLLLGAPVLAALALAATAGLALYAVPLWTVVAAVALTGAALIAVSVRETGLRGLLQAVAGGVIALAAVLVAAPSPLLLTLTTGLVALLAIAILTTGRFPHAAHLGGAVLPLALAGFLWSSAEALEVDVALRGAPVLLVVGLLALLLPRLELEVASVVAVLATTPAAVAVATDTSTSLTLHLTLAGALVTASALVHPSRRALGWVGGLLLAAATWVRLADLGVSSPEAYTLPAASALVLVGLYRLRSDATASTSTALTPGLVLATVPSLLWVLASDPVSVRAVLLGAACLTLVLVGSRLRWSAPLVVGAVVGGLLVLREVAPYAAQTPQWVTIGVAGTLLTVVGVTWERRLLQLQHAAGYVARLR